MTIVIICYKCSIVRKMVKGGYAFLIMNNTFWKEILWIVGIALVGWGIYAFINKPKAVIVGTEKSLVIGSVLPLTGTFGILGEDIRRGADLAIFESKAKYPNLIYISEDDHFEQKTAATAANKLISVDKIDMAFTAAVQEAKSMAPIFNGAKIPLLITWDSNEFIKTAGSNIFTIGFSTEGNGEKMAIYGYSDLKLRRVAIINHVDEWSELIAQAFEAKFKALGGTVVAHESALPPTTDYRIQILKAKAANADAIYFPLLSPANGIVALQARQLGFKGAFLSGDSILQDEIDAAKGAAEGMYYTTVYADNTKALLEKYKAKYAVDPADIVFVSFGYDGIRTLLAAYDIAQANGSTLRDALTRVSINGAGALITMNGRQYSERLEKIYKVIGNKPVLVAE